MIKFKKIKQQTKFHNPKNSWQLEEKNLEIRFDPLTGLRSIASEDLINKKGTLFPETDFAFLQQVAKETEKKCFLCPDKWQKQTPLFPEDFIPEGRINFGQATVFPNLYPLAPLHAVVRLGDQHLRLLNQLPKELLFDGLKASQIFMQRALDYDPSLKYGTINANYLFPAGASATHPHFQLLADSEPSNWHALLLKKARAFYQRNQVSYFDELIRIEKEKGERYIGQIGQSFWITAFAPAGYNEILAIFPTRQNILEFSDQDLLDLALGLEKIFKFEFERQLSTFNFSLFSSPFAQDHPEFRTILRLVNRQNVVPHHRTDDYFFQKLLKNEIIVHPPEELANWIRSIFQKDGQRYNPG